MTRTERYIVLVFTGLKLLVHFATNTNYTFHRDEFLYIDEGQHLSWGFLEIPPLTPFLGRIVTTIAGDNVFGVRLLPALAGAIVVLLIGRIVKELGGGKWALVLACTAFLMSPAFLRTNTLFQPVCLDQLWWVTSALLLILIVKYLRLRDYILIGIAFGLGWQTKYTIVFIAAAMVMAVMISGHRRTVNWKYAGISICIAILIALPNLIWQYVHNFPVIAHMEELSQTQLRHVETGGFLMGQLLMQFAGVLIWLPGLLWLLFTSAGRPYRYLGWTYVFVVGLLLVLSGKDYYTLGIYPVMMSAGGVAIEEWTRNKRSWRYAIVCLVIALNLFTLPIGLPLLSNEGMVRYCKRLETFGIEQRWEDGRKYAIPQDYADMQGWEEPVATVAKHFHALPKETQATCIIYGGSYAHAGPLNYYREKYHLPVAYSLDASYVFWIPDSLSFDNMFLVDNRAPDPSPLFERQHLLDSTHNIYARDHGYVFYRSGPLPGIDSIVSSIIATEKEKYSRSDQKN